MTSSRTLLLAFAGALLAAVVALAVSTRATTPAPARAPSAETETTPVANVPVEGPAPTPVAAPAALAVAPAAPAASGPLEIEDVLAPDAPTAQLVAGIASADPVIVGEAANALVARGAVDALPALIAEDVLARPKAAPSIIYALGKLAKTADAANKDAAVDRLLALLAAEKQRGAQESQGNLLQIYEALGDTGSPRAIAPLEAELLDATVKTAPKVVVVQALVALRATGSRDKLELLATQLALHAAEEGLEAELKRDLLAVIREALVQLS